MTLLEKITTLNWFDFLRKIKEILLGISEESISDAPIDGSQYARQDATWTEVIGSAGSNGITSIDGNIKLGGTLTENTTIAGGGKRLYIGSAFSNDLDRLNISLSGNSDWNLGTSTYLASLNDHSNINLNETNLELKGSNGSEAGGRIYLGGGVNVDGFLPKGVTLFGTNGSEYLDKSLDNTQSVGIRLNANGGVALFRDGRTIKKGLEYEADYSSAYTSRSLVDRGYIDNIGAVANSTTAALSAATLTSTYPNAIIGFRVQCLSISGGAIVYQKSTSGWIQQTVTTVA